MKLKTKDIVPIVVTNAKIRVLGRFDQQKPIDAASVEKLWKRLRKWKFKAYREEECGLELEDVERWFNDEMSFGAIDIFDNQKVTDDCICRSFVNTVLEDELDATVVSDPTDTKILFIKWHSD